VSGINKTSDGYKIPRESDYSIRTREFIMHAIRASRARLSRYFYFPHEAGPLQRRRTLRVPIALSRFSLDAAALYGSRGEPTREASLRAVVVPHLADAAALEGGPVLAPRP